MGKMRSGDKVKAKGPLDAPMGAEVRFPGVCESLDTVYAVSPGLTMRQGIDELGALVHLAEGSIALAIRDDPNDQRLRGVQLALSAASALAASLHRGLE
jgi:hypothetical protein